MAFELKKVEDKDEALMCLLRSVNELYEEHQKGAKSMRKGFLNMAKARQSMGRGALSALDCREEMNAQLSISHIGGNEVSIDDLSASRLFSKDRSQGTNRISKPLRRPRRSGGEEGNSDDEGLIEDSPEASNNDKDPINMFGALPPPALRRSKEDFTTALDHYIAAANLIHRISTVQQALAPLAPIDDSEMKDPQLNVN